MTYAVPPRNSCGTHLSRVRLLSATLLLALMMSLQSIAAEAQKTKTNSISAVPTIQQIVVQNGQLLASGTVTAVIKGRTFTAPFSNVPVNISLAPNQPAGADCPVLDLSLGPIHVNLLGLVVDTSAICLQITAHQGGGLLGDLLCTVGNLLNGGLSLADILNGLGLSDPLTGNILVPGLTSTQIGQLIGGLTDLLNAALNQLYQAILTAIDIVHSGHTCGILHLELGPLDLTLLGLEVVLDNCKNGPVTVDLTAVTGKGNLLGNLLCELLDGGLINLGTTLQGILNQILGLLG